MLDDKVFYPVQTKTGFEISYCCHVCKEYIPTSDSKLPSQILGQSSLLTITRLILENHKLEIESIWLLQGRRANFSLIRGWNFPFSRQVRYKLISVSLFLSIFHVLILKILIVLKSFLFDSREKVGK